MEYKSVKGYSGWAQVGFLCVFLGAGFVLTAIVQMFVLSAMLPAGKSILDGEATMMKAMLAPENINLSRFLQFISTLLLLFLPAWLWSRVSNGRPLLWLGFSKYFSAGQVLLGFVIIFCAAVAAAPLAEFSEWAVSHFPRLEKIAEKMEADYNAQVTALSNLTGWGEYLMALVIMAFLPAIFEETFFRGAMQNLFVKWWKAPLAAIIFTSIIFSLIHLSIYLFLSRFLLGIVLGYLYHETKNLWVPIIAHFLNNAIAVTAMFVMSMNGKKPTPQDLEPQLHWAFAAAAALATILLFIRLRKTSVAHRERILAKEQVLLAERDPFHSFGEPQNDQTWV